MVEWSERLLLIIRYYACCHSRNKLIKTEVFAMDLSTMPCGVIQMIRSTRGRYAEDGSCLAAVSGGPCSSSPAVVRVLGARVYFQMAPSIGS